MYNSLGIHWASSIPAFLALACVPFPFLLYKYGKLIRMKCKYAAQADEALGEMRGGGSKEEDARGEMESGEKRDRRDETDMGLGDRRSLGDMQAGDSRDLGSETPVDKQRENALSKEQ